MMKNHLFCTYTLKTWRVHCGILKPVFLSGLEAEGSIIYLSCWVSSKTEGTDGRPLASIPIERSAYVPCAVTAAMSSGQSKNACIYLLIDCVSVQKMHVSKYILTPLKKIRDTFKGPELCGKIIIQAFLNLNFAIT